MSGVEVLGIVASVIQITQYAMSITSKVAEIYGAVESAPARVQQGSDQLQRLCATVELIKDNPMIQTESVEAHLDAIVADAKTLHGMLSRLATSSKKSFKRYLRVWLGNFEERQIVAQFDKIEKEKTALILSLIEIHASFSNTTLYTVRPMANQVNDIHQDMQKLTVSSTLNKPGVVCANYRIGNPAANQSRERDIYKGDTSRTQACGEL